EGTTGPSCRTDGTDEVGVTRPSDSEGAFHPLEGAGPCPRRGPGLKADTGTRRGDPQVSEGPGPPLPASRARQIGNRAEGVLQVAGGPLGPRELGRHRLPAGRLVTASDPGQRVGIMSTA